MSYIAAIYKIFLKFTYLVKSKTCSYATLCFYENVCQGMMFST